MSKKTRFYPECPYCEQEFTDDDNYAQDSDVYALAPKEESERLKCPSCNKEFECLGSYIPEYETFTLEECEDD